MRSLTKKARAARSPFSNRTRLRVEELESRLVPYSLSGSAWPHPEVIRIGVAYDSVNLGGVSSNLFNSFDGRFVHQGVWIPEFLRAAQVWAEHTNLNFVFAIDDGSNLGAGLYQQGDPYKPDIRIGGYDFGSSALATAYLPPAANNFSLAGDIQFNTAQPWVMGETGGYDVFTVAMHEIGHALGLGHSSNYYSVMFPYYVGSRAGLGADDINGIRALYSGGAGRSPDAIDAAASNQYLGTGPSLDPFIDWSTLTVNLSELDITSPTDVDFFSFHVPGGTTGTMTVQLQGLGRSLLAPALTVYDVYGQQIGYVAGGGPWGGTVSLTFTGVTPYETYYVSAAAADPSSPFSVGKYSLMINHGNSAMPALSVPSTQTPNGSPLRSSSSQPQGSDHDHDHDGGCPFCGGRVTDGASEARTPSQVNDINANLVAILNGAAAPTWSSPISEDEADPVSLPRHEEFLPPVSDMPGLVRAAVLPPETGAEASVAALDACFADDLGLALEKAFV